MSCNPPDNSEAQVLQAHLVEEKRPPKKKGLDLRLYRGMVLGRLQFPLLYRGLTPALLFSLQVVVGVKQHNEQVQTAAQIHGTVKQMLIGGPTQAQLAGKEWGFLTFPFPPVL